MTIAPGADVSFEVPIKALTPTTCARRSWRVRLSTAARFVMAAFCVSESGSLSRSASIFALVPEESFSSEARFLSCFATRLHAVAVVAHFDSPRAPASFCANTFGSFEMSASPFEARSATPVAKPNAFAISALPTTPSTSRRAPESAASMYSETIDRSIESTNLLTAESSSPSAASSAAD